MAQIAVTIDGKSYRIACEDGQEPQIERLAADLDQRIVALRRNVGEIGDMRLAIMGALTVSDELAETRARLARAEAETEALRAQLAESHRARLMATEAAAEGINGIAQRIERIARAVSEPDSA
jgi:cell division protein ZapA